MNIIKIFLVFFLCLEISILQSMAFEPVNIRAMAYSPDGKKLAICFGTIIDVYNVEKKERIQRFMNEEIVSSVKFINNDECITSVYTQNDSNRRTNIQFFNITTGECIKQVRCCFFPNHAIICSRDGVFCLESQSQHHNPVLWNINEQKCVKVFSKSNNEKILALAITDDNASCATGSTQSTIKLFDVTTEQQTANFNETNPLASLTFSSDKKLLISATEDNKDGIKVWDISSGAIIKKRTPEYNVIALACAPDDNTIAYTGIGDKWPRYFIINSNKDPSCMILRADDFKRS